MGTDCNICSNKCMGFTGNHGGCCTVADRNFIIGPHSDSHEFLERLSKKFGRDFEYDEVFYSYETGKNIFPNKSIWQEEISYPALKLDFYNPLLPCMFYNTKLKCCTIYEIRPQTCQNYECDYLRDNT